jgi:uncharacterized protein DUF6210
MRISGANDNMVIMPSIQLPLDGDEPEDWLLLVVRAPTGVAYEQQYGGYVCNHVEVEGFLVPVCQPQVLAKLREAFADPRLGGRGILGTQGWPEKQLQDFIRDVESIVSTIGYRTTSEEPLRDVPVVALDRERVHELDEAWVPVRTPDGPGYVAWVNSD